MSLSIRNQLPGTITAITPGEVMAAVKVHLNGGQDLTAAITLDAVEDLGLAEGAAVTALVKATEISSPPPRSRACPSATNSPARSPPSPRVARWHRSRSLWRAAP